jgi:anhydro-N-acetylmuramic acid kinase
MVKDLAELNILGVMSGTSLDGLDLAACSFSYRSLVWEYRIIKATTLTYPEELRHALENAMNLTSADLCNLDHIYGKWIGNACKNFILINNLNINYIASHGHTIFHQPANAFTLQIGNGNDIAALTGKPVIYDFRSMDVALGGQGAPLVPVGDEYLFEKFDSCLNLGGFSNISYKKDGRRIAFDICPVNMGLNYLAGLMGFEYDKDGNAGRQGKTVQEIIDRLDNLNYYKLNPPKSLGREWFNEHALPILQCNRDTKDVLRSFYEHIAIQVSREINERKGKKVLITGGGAKNTFLLERISEKTDCEILVPDKDLIDFKEALIFGFLGFLKVNGIPNVLSSVTGASQDHCSGVITVK